MAWIYRIICVENDYFYIGSTRQERGLPYRYYAHLSELRRGVHKNSKLQIDFLTYGEDKFVFEMVEECEEDASYFREQYYLDLYFETNSHQLYNKSKIASGSSYEHSEQHREKINLTRRSNNEEWHSPETRAKIGAATEGRIVPESTRQKMSEAHTGREITWSDKISAANKGKVRTAEQNAANSAARKGVPTGRTGKPVRCIETGVIYRSSKFANGALGIKLAGAIAQAIRNSGKCVGYHWEYVTLEEFENQRQLA